MRERLDRLEQRLENIIEGSLASLLGARLSAGTVASKLTAAMAEVVKEDEGGRTYAPDKYALTLNPQDAETLLTEEPGVQEKLSQGLLEAARESDLVLARDPHITIAADPTLHRWEVRAVAWHSGNPLEFTHAMERPGGGEHPEPPGGAFLIVDGRGHFSLDRPVINIGRRLDNQLILDNPRVSRTHAQLRVREGRYVLFDLGSTAGTQVNGRSIKQHVLRAGDVIKIADVRLVYGEDPTGPPDPTATYSPPFPPQPAGDLRTRSDIREDDGPDA